MTCHSTTLLFTLSCVTLLYRYPADGPLQDLIRAHLSAANSSWLPPAPLHPVCRYPDGLLHALRAHMHAFLVDVAATFPEQHQVSRLCLPPSETRTARYVRYLDLTDGNF